MKNGRIISLLRGRGQFSEQTAVGFSGKRQFHFVPALFALLFNSLLNCSAAAATAPVVSAKSAVQSIHPGNPQKKFIPCAPG